MDLTTDITDVQEIEFVIKILVGFLVGALIGVERERARLITSSKEPRSLPGVRSFGLLSLYGAITAHTALILEELGLMIIQFFVIIVFTSIIVFLTILYMYQRVTTLGKTGITTYIVMGLDLGLGFLVGLGKILEAISASILITFILAIKPSIKKFVKEISYKELLSGLELGLFVFILGPIFLLKPIVVMGLDLSKLYLLFIIILSLSFLSYVGVKIKGGKALKYISFLGGLVNSEASAANISMILSSQTDLPIDLSRSIMKKNMFIIIAAMLMRNLIIIGMLSFSSLTLNDATVVMGLVTISFIPSILLGIFAWILEKEATLRNIRVEIQNPLSISTALKIIFVYASIFIVSYLLYFLFGTKALYLIALVGGVVNAGATILTLFALFGMKLINTDVLTSILVLTNFAAIVNKVIYVYAVVKNKALVLACLYAVALTASLALIFYTIASRILVLIS